MSSEERTKILQMVEEGKISAEEAMRLIQVLEEGGSEAQDDFSQAPAAETVVEPESFPRPDPNSEFERKLKKFRRLWVIPLWIGVILTIAGAGWMYSAMQNSGFGFWFFCSWLPFLLGVGAIALAFGSRTSRWIYVDVRNRSGESPQRIRFGFPFPAGMVRWGIRNFGHHIPDRERKVADDTLKAVFETPTDEPIMVDVQEEDGEHVQVYIG
jgi:hypothetical protein